MARLCPAAPPSELAVLLQRLLQHPLPLELPAEIFQDLLHFHFSESWLRTAPRPSRSEVTGLIGLQSKLLREATERLHSEMSRQNESLNSRLGEAIRSLEFAHAEITELKARDAKARRANDELWTRRKTGNFGKNRRALRLPGGPRTPKQPAFHWQSQRRATKPGSSVFCSST